VCAVQLEALATCHTNIDCLKTLLDAVADATDQHHTVNGLIDSLYSVQCLDTCCRLQPSK